MGKHRYKKLEPSHIRGVCVKCNTHPQKPRGDKFRSLCAYCDKLEWDSKKEHRKAVGATCETCGFIPTHVCQLDVDHIDGNHENNSPENLQTLCANCHRLKTWENRDNKAYT